MILDTPGRCGLLGCLVGGWQVFGRLLLGCLVSWGGVCFWGYLHDFGHVDGLFGESGGCFGGYLHDFGHGLALRRLHSHSRRRVNDIKSNSIQFNSIRLNSAQFSSTQFSSIQYAMRMQFN